MKNKNFLDIIMYCIPLIIFSCESIKKKEVALEKEYNQPNQNVHTFYYNWYGNVKYDKKFRHWNHQIMPHWSDTTWNKLPNYNGFDDIGANFSPSLGTYSSNNPELIKDHMIMISKSGIGTICVSWWGKDSFEDLNINLILDAAEKENLKVNFHIEPFPNRTAISTIKMIKYIINKYGSHNAFYKYNNKPLFYIYDSYLISKEEWSDVLGSNTSLSIRGTKYDSIFIGLWVEKNEELFFNESGFDGFYTYFASDGFTFGSTKKNWKYLSNWANKNNKIFIPCVGPGYEDTKVRPWNDQNTKPRNNGLYYDKMFSAAIKVKPDIIGVTSFNEWHEGTQIEPASSNSTKNFSYKDYGTLGSNFYLDKTKYWVSRFLKKE